MKKTFAAIVLIIFIAGIFPLFPAQRVHAALGVDAFITESFNAAQAIIKKRFFDMVVEQIVNWIQGGGQPLFIQNWDAFLASYGNIVTGDIVTQLGLGAVCRPFGIQLQVAVMQPPRFTNQITCTLDQIVGNMVNFYNNFRTGGFIAYREIWQPKNNFYGGIILTMNEKEVRAADQRFAAQQEAQANNGFLGTRKCDTNGRNCYIVTPGMQIGAAAAKLMGGDLDYIINATDLAAYTAAISDAFINRLIRGGAEGLQGIVVRNAPPLGYIVEQPAGHAPCAGLSGNTLNSCLALQGISARNANLTRETYVNQLTATLAPLQNAEQNILAVIDVQNKLATKLNELRSCQGGRNLPGLEQTSSDVRTEERALADFNQTLLNLQQITIPLVNVKTKLQNATTTDPVAISQIMGGVYQSFDEQRATAYQTTVQKQRDDLVPKITTRLPQIQTQIDQCGRS